MPVERSKVEYTRARWQIDAHAHWKSSGARLATPEEMLDMNPKDLPRTFSVHSLERPYDYQEHVRLGEELEKRNKLSSNFMMLAPAVGDDCEDVWTDVVRQLTINGTQTARGFEKHVCPMQYDLVDRLIDRYTNPGDLVFDPFAGLGTTPMRSVKHGRRGRGHELNGGYFHHSVGYLREAEQKVLTPDLFSSIEEESEYANA
jgi:DNA modification methylase